jgi:serine/threonine-protein kinase HipA
MKLSVGYSSHAPRRSTRLELSGEVSGDINDFNPVPSEIKPRILSTAIDLEDGTISLERAPEVADYFEIDASANATAAGIGQAVATWRAVTTELSLSSSRIDRVVSAFEHQNLQASLT